MAAPAAWLCVLRDQRIASVRVRPPGDGRQVITPSDPPVGLRRTLAIIVMPSLGLPFQKACQVVIVFAQKRLGAYPVR